MAFSWRVLFESYSFIATIPQLKSISYLSHVCLIVHVLVDVPLRLRQHYILIISNCETQLIVVETVSFMVVFYSTRICSALRVTNAVFTVRVST